MQYSPPWHLVVPSPLKNTELAVVCIRMAASERAGTQVSICNRSILSATTPPQRHPPRNSHTHRTTLTTLPTSKQNKAVNQPKQYPPHELEPDRRRVSLPLAGLAGGAGVRPLPGRRVRPGPGPSELRRRVTAGEGAFGFRGSGSLGSSGGVSSASGTPSCGSDGGGRSACAGIDGGGKLSDAPGAAGPAGSTPVTLLPFVGGGDAAGA
jgi:hypothetical protein